jgi:threonyl-tRNA synthetase
MSEDAFKAPHFIDYRLKLWDELKLKKQQQLEDKSITITLPDGKQIEGKAGVTTPYDVAAGVSEQFAKKFIVARVNGKLHDYGLPIDCDCKLELLDFKSPEGKHVFWHSSGFFYDIQLEDKAVSSEDFAGLNQFVNKIIGEKQPFERLTLTKAEALELFKFNPFKLDIISSKVPEDGTTSAYKCGPLIDLCRGPHIRNTGVIAAFEVTKNSGSYYKGDANQPVLNRVYGISFPDSKLMKEYKKFKEAASKRDHRKIGEDQSLFFFDKLSPGSCFFLPHGARIYNKLMDTIRGEYRDRGYTEVITPNVYNLDLWRTSGHLDNYKENMFIFECEKQEFGLKPMNCPGHCLMFKHQLRSYRDLPIRYADFGVLHRNEISGALTGLTRVRRFQQDDAHIFCTPDQIFDEVLSVLEFMKRIYGIFGFKFSLALSTRPAKALGDIELWNQAEKALADVLDKFGQPWTINAGDGAFYGPKIDIRVTDALRRKHQCATVQLDFQLPIRFELQYKNANIDVAAGETHQRPVIIHRAILGSVERFIAVLTEHTGGKWPFWISPRQVMIVPVSLKFSDYAEEVRKELHAAGFFVDADLSNLTLNKKIREAQLSQYNFILAVGSEEMESRSVSVRSRDNKIHGKMTISEVIAKFNHLTETFEMDPDLDLLVVDDAEDDSPAKPSEEEDFL